MAQRDEHQKKSGPVKKNISMVYRSDVMRLVPYFFSVLFGLSVYYVVWLMPKEFPVAMSIVLALLWGFVFAIAETILLFWGVMLAGAFIEGVCELCQLSRDSSEFRWKIATVLLLFFGGSAAAWIVL